jgi:hypothetical protein
MLGRMQILLCEKRIHSIKTGIIEAVDAGVPPLCF